MENRVVRFLVRLVLAAAIAAVGTWGLGAVWVAIGGGPLSIHGWIAMTLGILGTVGLSWVLMSLAFRSDREGWDDRVDNDRDPGRKAAED
jgi:cation transporter-like permease